MGDQSDKLEGGRDSVGVVRFGSLAGAREVTWSLLLFPQGLTRGMVRFWEKRPIRGRGSQRAGAGRVPAAAVAGLQRRVAAGLHCARGERIPVQPGAGTPAPPQPQTAVRRRGAGQGEGRCLCKGTR